MAIRISNVLDSISSKFLDCRSFLKEKKIAKNLNMKLNYYNGNEISTELFLMREPIANFAKKHNVKIDIFNSDKLSAEPLKKTIQPDRIAVRVSNPKNSVSVSEVFDCDISKVYSKEKRYRFPVLYDVPGEDTQKPLTAIWSVEDSLLRHIFRTMEAMVAKVQNK